MASSRPFFIIYPHDHWQKQQPKKWKIKSPTKICHPLCLGCVYIYMTHLTHLPIEKCSTEIPGVDRPLTPPGLHWAPGG